MVNGRLGSNEEVELSTFSARCYCKRHWQKLCITFVVFEVLPSDW